MVGDSDGDGGRVMVMVVIVMVMVVIVLIVQKCAKGYICLFQLFHHDQFRIFSKVCRLE